MTALANDFIKWQDVSPVLWYTPQFPLLGVLTQGKNTWWHWVIGEFCGDCQSNYCYLEQKGFCLWIRGVEPSSSSNQAFGSSWLIWSWLKLCWIDFQLVIQNQQHRTWCQCSSQCNMLSLSTWQMTSIDSYLEMNAIRKFGNESCAAGRFQHCFHLLYDGPWIAIYNTVVKTEIQQQSSLGYHLDKLLLHGCISSKEIGPIWE